MHTQDILERLTQQPGVSGREDGAASAAMELLAPYGEPRLDRLGNLVCLLRSGASPSEAEIHLVLDAHLDEIGLIVTAIDDRGFLKVAACGGVDRRLLLASQVTVHGAMGPVEGIVASIPPHLQTGEQKNPTVEEIAVDIGYSREEALRRVAPGDRITFHGPFTPHLNGRVSSKALDNRAGCAVILKALEYLGNEPLDIALTVLFSTREETGGAGVQTGAFALAPTHALVTDVSFGYAPGGDRCHSGEMDGGPMIGYAPVLSREVFDSLVALAREEEIPYQLEIMGGRTGTNSDGLAASRTGVKTGLISIPLLNMHSPVEIVSVRDVERCARLMAAYIRRLSASSHLRREGEGDKGEQKGGEAR